MSTTDEARRQRTLAGSATHVRFGIGTAVASTVYGTIIVMATITAAYAGEKDPWKLAGIVAGAVVVLWLAHLYAHSLGESLGVGHATPALVLAIARRELGIVLAAVLPITALVLGGIGVLKETTCVWIAMGIGLATLAGEGVRYARVAGFGPGRMAIAVGLNVALGLLVVALKIVVAH